MGEKPGKYPLSLLWLFRRDRGVSGYPDSGQWYASLAGTMYTTLYPGIRNQHKLPCILVIMQCRAVALAIEIMET